MKKEQITEKVKKPIIYVSAADLKMVVELLIAFVIEKKGRQCIVSARDLIEIRVLTPQEKK